MVDPFATAAEVCEFTGIAQPTDLARLQSQLQMASSVIRGYCDQTLSSVEDDVITLYPSVSTFLSLPERPVTAVAEVEVDGAVTTDFYIVPRGLRSGSVAVPGTAWLRGATVTYSHGYAETEPEFDLFKTVCIKMAARAFAPTEVLPSTVVESAGFTPAVFLTPDEKESLRQFRRGPVR